MNISSGVFSIKNIANGRAQKTKIHLRCRKNSKRKINGISVSPIEKTFENFLDVHEINFNEWWVFQKMRLERNKANRIHSPVDNYVTGQVSLVSDLDYCIDHYKQYTGREPSAQELKYDFVEMLNDRGGEQKMLFLRVNLTSKLEDINAGFKKIMASDEVKKKMEYGKTWRGFFDNIERTGKPRLDGLQDYLDAYDMWKEQVVPRKPGDPSGWKKIIQHFEPGAKLKDADECVKMFKKKYSRKPSPLELEETLSEEQKKFSNMGRKYKRYKEKAEQIISNVERGYFPGEY